MNMEDMEKLYMPSYWSHRFDTSEQVLQNHLDIITKGSHDARAKLPCRLDIAYGDSERQKFDLFGEDSLPKDCSVLVYIHGGYWQELSREESSYIAEPFYKAGCIVAVVGYDLAPRVTLDVIVAQIQRAIEHIAQKAKTRGSRGVYVCGHSAGAHLAAMLMQSAQWNSGESDLPNIIKGYFLVSGVYDLVPLLKTSVNAALNLDQTQAEYLSPFHITKKHVRKECPVLVAVGKYDSPAFTEQSQDYAKLLVEAGINSSYRLIDDVDHFSIVENLRDTSFGLTKVMLSTMELQ